MVLCSSPGVNPAYQTEDANEDTIGVLVRLITEKKGEGGGLTPSLPELCSAPPAGIPQASVPLSDHCGS